LWKNGTINVRIQHTGNISKTNQPRLKCNTKIVLKYLFSLLVACKQKIQPTDIAKINGYWEIEK
jgi:hypothetical protein